VNKKKRAKRAKLKKKKARIHKNKYIPLGETVIRKDLGNHLKMKGVFEGNEDGVLIDAIRGSFDELIPGAIVSMKEGEIELSIMTNCEDSYFLGTIRFCGLSLEQIKYNFKQTGRNGKRVRFTGLHKTHTVKTETYTVINAIFEDVSFKKGSMWFGCPYYFPVSGGYKLTRESFRKTFLM